MIQVMSRKDLDSLASDHVQLGISYEQTITKVLEGAQSFVDGYLLNLVDVVPMTAPSAQIIHVTMVVAKHRLFQRRRMMTDEENMEYNDAMKWLKMLVARQVKDKSVEDQIDTEDGTDEAAAGFAAVYDTDATLPGTPLL